MAAPTLMSSITWFIVLLLSTLANAQTCANNVAIYHPDLRTAASTNTWFIVPAPRAAVQTALDQAFPLQDLTLLDLPTTDPTLFPTGFPTDMHPVLCTIGLQTDIRMTSLQIPTALKTGAILATYISQHGNPTPLSAALNSYIAGPDGPLPDGLVPALASPLLFGGTSLRLGLFEPPAPPYASDAAGTLTAEAKWATFPNGVSGPGVYIEAIDFLFRFLSPSDQPQTYTPKLFKTLINQPGVLPSGLCQRNQYYFTNDTALTKFARGNMTVGPAASGDGVFSGNDLFGGVLQKAAPGGRGFYADNEAIVGCAQSVGFTPEGCEEAGRNLDLTALE